MAFQDYAQLDNLQIEKLIGVPYRHQARGPDAFDCYGLVIHMHRQIGIELPDVGSPKDQRLITAAIRSELRLWTPCSPRLGAVALFRVPGMFHCGFLLNDNDFIHTWEHSGGVCIEQLSDWQARLVEVYEYTGE